MSSSTQENKQDEICDEADDLNDPSYEPPTTEMESSSSDQFENSDDDADSMIGSENIDDKEQRRAERNAAAKNQPSSSKKLRKEIAATNQLSKERVVEAWDKLRDLNIMKTRPKYQTVDNNLLFDSILDFCRTADIKEWCNVFPIFKRNTPESSKFEIAIKKRLRNEAEAGVYLNYFKRTCFRSLVCSLILKIAEFEGKLEGMDSKYKKKLAINSDKSSEVWGGRLMLPVNIPTSSKVLPLNPDVVSPDNFVSYLHSLMNPKHKIKVARKLEIEEEQLKRDIEKDKQEVQSKEQKLTMLQEKRKIAEQEKEQARREDAAFKLFTLIFPKPEDWDFPINIFLDIGTSLSENEGDILSRVNEVVTAAEIILAEQVDQEELMEQK